MISSSSLIRSSCSRSSSSQNHQSLTSSTIH
ncbi:hypothetical protein DFA_10378 [Cavenderia fasciculata]|uniref:Uncharacterized protein n=1 Tax=Cavenderia fasciculata TaxID=261658 RepID=F4QA17_CACFS|nr:uncharacterized protein DFA_10378 [Cavenderia fasciculata]EGG15536.1 hypothetical protein DFA_10378 [Cavenderia fasciculata]|eukprot:XP_004354278.1 hypothetical protein DFA_10378 [Cavenderia fasciculata]